MTSAKIDTVEIIETLKQKEPPLAGTTQLADSLEVEKDVLLETLHEMQSDGLVGKRKIGQSYAWFLMQSEDMKYRHEKIQRKIITAIRGHKAPFMSTTDLADELGYTNPGIQNHLDRLLENGKLKRAKVGNAWAYYLPEE